MGPENLRNKNKFDYTVDALILVMNPSERDKVVKLHSWYSTEAVKQISAPIAGQAKGSAETALELINYYFHNGPRPFYLSNLSELWIENLPQ